MCQCFANCKNKYSEENDEKEQQENNQEYKTIAFVGQKESGKSSLIYFLQNGLIKKQTQKIEQIEQNEIKFENEIYEFKEVPQRYISQAKSDAWVYVLDQSKFQGFKEINQFLSNLDGKQPVLLFLNKSDLVSEQQSLDVQKIKWNKVKNYKIYETNNKGENVKEGIQWLTIELKRGLKK